MFIIQGIKKLTDKYSHHNLFNTLHVYNTRNKKLTDKYSHHNLFNTLRVHNTRNKKTNRQIQPS